MLQYSDNFSLIIQSFVYNLYAVPKKTSQYSKSNLVTSYLRGNTLFAKYSYCGDLFRKKEASSPLWELHNIIGNFSTLVKTMVELLTCLLPSCLSNTDNRRCLHWPLIFFTSRVYPEAYKEKSLKEVFVKNLILLKIFCAYKSTSYILDYGTIATSRTNCEPFYPFLFVSYS